MASSVTPAAAGEAVSNRLRKNWLWLLGRRYDVEVFEEIRPDAQCGRCCGWTHIEAQCNREPRCACAQEDTPPPSTGIRLRFLVGKARRPHTPWLSVSAAVARTSPRRMCARRGRGSGRQPKGGARCPHRHVVE